MATRLHTCSCLLVGMRPRWAAYTATRTPSRRRLTSWANPTRCPSLTPIIVPALPSLVQSLAMVEKLGKALQEAKFYRSLRCSRLAV